MEKYKVIIHITGKDSVKDEHYTTFDVNETNFNTLDEAKEFIKDRYNDKKPKTYMYQDKKDGSSMRIGWIYSYWNKDYSHDSKKWLQEDWVSINKVITEPVEV